MLLAQRSRIQDTAGSQLDVLLEASQLVSRATPSHTRLLDATQTLEERVARSEALLLTIPASCSRIAN
jgi:hypothetical protein